MHKWKQLHGLMCYECVYALVGYPWAWILFYKYIHNVLSSVVNLGADSCGLTLMWNVIIIFHFLSAKHGKQTMTGGQSCFKSNYNPSSRSRHWIFATNYQVIL